MFYPPTSAPDGHPVGEKPLTLQLPSDYLGSNLNPRKHVMRCKPHSNPRVDFDRPAHVPTGLTTYVLTRFTASSPPFHATVDNVESDLKMERVEPDTILQNRFARGLGGEIMLISGRG